MDYTQIAHELDGVPYGHFVIVDTRTGEVGSHLFTRTDRPRLGPGEILVEGRWGDGRWTHWTVRSLLGHVESDEQT